MRGFDLSNMDLLADDAVDFIESSSSHLPIDLFVSCCRALSMIRFTNLNSRKKQYNRIPNSGHVDCLLSLIQVKFLKSLSCHAALHAHFECPQGGHPGRESVTHLRTLNAFGEANHVPCTKSRI